MNWSYRLYWSIRNSGGRMLRGKKIFSGCSVNYVKVRGVTTFSKKPLTTVLPTVFPLRHPEINDRSFFPKNLPYSCKTALFHPITSNQYCPADIHHRSGHPGRAPAQLGKSRRQCSHRLHPQPGGRGFHRQPELPGGSGRSYRPCLPDRWQRPSCRHRLRSGRRFRHGTMPGGCEYDCRPAKITGDPAKAGLHGSRCGGNWVAFLRRVW